MGKQSKQLMILLLVLLLLIAGFWGIRQYNKVQSEKPEESTDIMVIDVSVEDIVKFSYDYEGVTYSFEKEEDTWYYAEDKSISINQNSIKTMLNRLAPLTAKQELKGVTDMTQYGLDTPSRRIEYATVEESYSIELGDRNSVASIYYMCKNSEDTVYVVEPQVYTVFEKDLEDLKEVVEESTEIEK